MDMNAQDSRLTELLIDEDLMDRMVRAVERVRERMHRAASALEEAGIPYAVIGGNAVAAHVGRVDESAVRNTQDVDILLKRTDLEAAKVALARAGFVYRHVKGIDMFLDGPKAKARDAVHIIFAGERVRSVDLCPPRRSANRKRRRVSRRGARVAREDEADVVSIEGSRPHSRHDRRRPGRRDLASRLPAELQATAQGAAG